jgi:hypothetical protein
LIAFELTFARSEIIELLLNAGQLNLNAFGFAQLALA